MKQLAWRLVKPLIRPWLKDRALRLPKSDIHKIAATLKVPDEVVLAVNEEIITYALAEFDRFRV